MEWRNKPELIWERIRQSLMQGRHSPISQLTTKTENCSGVASDKDGRDRDAEMNQNIHTLPA